MVCKTDFARETTVPMRREHKQAHKKEESTHTPTILRPLKASLVPLHKPGRRDAWERKREDGRREGQAVCVWCIQSQERLHDFLLDEKERRQHNGTKETTTQGGGQQTHARDEEGEEREESGQLQWLMLAPTVASAASSSSARVALTPHPFVATALPHVNAGSTLGVSHTGSAHIGGRSTRRRRMGSTGGGTGTDETPTTTHRAGREGGSKRI